MYKSLYLSPVAQNYMYSTFCQLRSKLANTHSITILCEEKYDTMVVDCHHSLCFCGDRTNMSLP